MQRLPPLVALNLLQQQLSLHFLALSAGNQCESLTLVCLSIYAASHTVLVLLEHGHSVVLIDNLSNSFPRVFDHMKKLAGDMADKMKYIKVQSTKTWQLRLRWFQHSSIQNASRPAVHTSSFEGPWGGAVLQPFAFTYSMAATVEHCDSQYSADSQT